MVNLHFKRPYYRVQEEGRVVKDAIVTYGKRGWIAQACSHGVHGHEVIVEYKKKLIIDLWLVKFEISWIGKGDSCPNLKTMSQASE